MPEDIETPQCAIPLQIEEDKSDEENEELNSELYVFGKLWHLMLKNGPLGTKWNESFVPVLKAGSSNEVEEKLPEEHCQYPAKMRYKDLPLYDHPRFQHKDSSEKEHRCPEAREKLIHKSLLPHIKSLRQWIQHNFTDFTYELRCIKQEAVTSFSDSSDEFIRYMRDPDNLCVRQPVVAFGGLSGFYLGKTLCQRLLFSGAGLLATGALCFPKETDAIFKEVLFCFWEIGASLSSCGYKKKVNKPCVLESAPPRTTLNPCPDRKDPEPCMKEEGDGVSRCFEV